MHDDHYSELYELKSKLIKELADCSKDEISANNLSVIDTLAHATKNVCKIMESMDEEGGYSERRPIYRGNYYMDGRDTWSAPYNERGRGSGARRDSMGRYSSDGYSNHDDGILEELYTTMKNAPDEATRRSIQSMINKMEGR